ncbi:MAG: hypothetical protein HY646_17365 [Acidobacteria bacterium]|nr:hypothetical protein [Acidobacteriota bacterium]
MFYRIVLAVLLSLSLCAGLSAQATNDAKFEILRTVIAEQAAARIAMPFGADGFELTETGEINKEKLAKVIEKNGKSIDVGKVVSITEISFDSNKIEIELDGGGKNKKSIWERIEVGTGTRTTPVKGDEELKKAKGSKIVLKFAKKVPQDITPEQLKKLLDPVLDFNKTNFLRTGIAALPPEFQEAVKAKVARVGMDPSTVIMAMGRPHDRVTEWPDGVETVVWIYRTRGYRVTFVTFENNVVVKVAQHGPAAQDNK